MIDLKTLSRSEKINLLKRVQAGSVSIVAGQIIENGTVLIEKDGLYYLNGSQVTINQFKKVPECTLIILPDNGRS